MEKEEQKYNILKIIDRTAITITAILIVLNLVWYKEILITADEVLILDGIVAVYFLITYFFNKSKFRMICSICCWISVIRFI